MPDIVTFDPINLRIIEINSALDVNTLSIREIYSEWKDWLLADASRKRFPQAFAVVGGEPISGTENLGSTFFLLFPWKIRAAEYDHNLILEGNIFTVPAGDSPVVGTLGDFQINYTFKVSTLVEQVAGGGGGGGGLTAQETADAVWEATVTDYEGTGTWMGGRILADFDGIPDDIWKAPISAYVGLTTEMGGKLLDGGINAGEVADAVWEATAASYTDTLQMGGKLKDDILSTPLTEAETADAVWEAVAAGYSNTAQMGGKLQDDILSTPLTVDETADAVWEAAAAAYTDTLEMGGRILDDLSNAGISQAEVADAVWQATAASYIDTLQMGGKLKADILDTPLTVDETADAVWEATQSAYTDQGQMGGKLKADILDTPLTVAETADAVWEAVAAGYTNTLEMGGKLQDDIANVASLSAAETADAVWKAAVVDYDGLTAEMGGKLLDSTGTTLNPSDLLDIADAVWEAATASYSDNTQMGGKILEDLASIVTTLSSGVGLTVDQQTQLLETWRILGLDPAAVLTVSKTGRTAGSISQLIEDNVPVAGSVRVTRQ
jgi:hypothetical protein